VNTVTANFNAIMGQMTKMSQRKKKPCVHPWSNPTWCPSGVVLGADM